MTTEIDNIVERSQATARRVAKRAYPFPGCCLCATDSIIGLEVAHLNHNSRDNDADNLCWLCRNHHGAYDRGFFSLEIVKTLRDHWQRMCGKATNRFMKDADRKAAATRAKNGNGSQIALKAVESRRRNVAAGLHQRLMKQ